MTVKERWMNNKHVLGVLALLLLTSFGAGRDRTLLMKFEQADRL